MTVLAQASPVDHGISCPYGCLYQFSPVFWVFKHTIICIYIFFYFQFPIIMKITFSIKLKAHCDSQVLITEPFSFFNHVIRYFHVGLYSRFHITPPSPLVSSDLLVRFLNSELWFNLNKFRIILINVKNKKFYFTTFSDCFMKLIDHNCKVKIQWFCKNFLLSIFCISHIRLVSW